MADMTWGPEYTWPVLPPVHQAMRFTSCRLSDNKFVMAYVYFSTHGADPANLEGRALVGVRTGTAIAYGPDAMFRQPMETQQTPLAICRLDDNRFVIFYKERINGFNDGHAFAIVGEVSGDTISWGAAVNISGSDARELSCCALSNSKFAVAYDDNGAGHIGTVCICTVSGNTITPGLPTVVIAARWTLCDLIKVDTDKFVGVWRDWITTNLFGAVFTVSGTTPTMHGIVTIDLGTVKDYYIDYLGNNKVVATWTEGVLFVNMHGQAAILTVSGNTFSVGAIVETQAAAGAGQGPYHPDVVAVGENNFLFVYSLSADATNRGISKWCDVVGTVITVGAQEIWSVNAIGPKDILYLKGDEVALPFIEGLAGPEKAIIGNGPFVLPTCTTNPATAVTAIGADLNGTLDDDGGEACDCGFEWGLTVAYGNTTPTSSKTTGQTFAQTIGGLAPGTTYHFRAFATNAAGTSYGADRTFTTLVEIPTPTTDPATDILVESSSLNGTLDDDGGEACDCGFEWGETVAYGNTTPTQSKVTGETFAQIIVGLAPSTTYHFRAFATNSAGTGHGADRTFITQDLLIINKAYALAREEL